MPAGRKSGKIGKTKYAPSPQRNHGGVQLSPKKYAQLCGTFGTQYPNLQPEDGAVSIRDAKYAYRVSADGYGGMIVHKKIKIK